MQDSWSRIMILRAVLTLSISFTSGCKDRPPDPNDTPVADFSVANSSGSAPLTVQFTNTSTGSYDTSSWNFGDASDISPATNPSHTYNTPGTYTVVLTVTGTEGSDTKTCNGCVFVEGVLPPEADFSLSPTSGVAPLAVNFTNLSTDSFNTSDWSFGDGSNDSSATSPSHIYNDPGIYTVTLTVSGPGGSDTKTRPECVTVLSDTQTVRIASGYIGGFCPTWDGGDRDFGGHGPDIRVNARFEPVNVGVARPEVRLIVDFHARETVPDYTSATGHWEWTVYTVPPGWKFDGFYPFVDDNGTDFRYTDVNHNPDVITYAAPEFVASATVVGDTDGPDVGNCTTDDCRIVRLDYRSVRVRLRRQ